MVNYHICNLILIFHHYAQNHLLLSCHCSWFWASWYFFHHSIFLIINILIFPVLFYVTFSLFSLFLFSFFSSVFRFVLTFLFLFPISFYSFFRFFFYILLLMFVRINYWIKISDLVPLSFLPKNKKLFLLSFLFLFSFFVIIIIIITIFFFKKFVWTKLRSDNTIFVNYFFFIFFLYLFSPNKINILAFSW